MENKALELFIRMKNGDKSVQTPSPMGRWLDGSLIEVAAGMLVWQFIVREEMTNPAKVLHGGAIAAMIDDAMGATVFTLGLPDFYTSINLNIDFLSSARLGDTLEVRATVIRQGKNVIHIVAEVSKSQKIIARASSNLIKIGA